MLSSIIKILVIVFILGVVGWVGLGIWAGACSNPDIDKMPELPDVTEGGDTFQVLNTGQLICSNNYEQHGEEIGSRIFVLHGFWEMRGNSFKYVAGDIVLNEKIFGEILLTKRGTANKKWDFSK